MGSQVPGDGGTGLYLWFGASILNARGRQVKTGNLVECSDTAALCGLPFELLHQQTEGTQSTSSNSEVQIGVDSCRSAMRVVQAIRNVEHKADS